MANAPADPPKAPASKVSLKSAPKVAARAQGPASVDDYLAVQPPEARAVLQQVRALIIAALPEAEERISYQIPAYRVPAGFSIYFSGWAKHYALYPASAEMVAALGPELAPYLANKGTLRFDYAKPVPAALIQRIARYRADEVTALAAAKAAAKTAIVKPESAADSAKPLRARTAASE